MVVITADALDHVFCIYMFGRFISLKLCSDIL